MQFIMLASFFLDAYAFSTEAVVGYDWQKRIKKSFRETVKGFALIKSFLWLSYFNNLFIYFYIFYQEELKID